MVNVILTRGPSKPSGTLGVMTLDGVKQCVTCELPWLNNAVGKSCIPVGTYQCVPYSSAKYKNVWQVMEVPGRKLILIHNGNTIRDIRGCILVGRKYGNFAIGDTSLPGVTDSVSTLAELKRTLPDKFTLTITQPQP